MTEKKIIFVLDDEADIIELVKVNLENNGFKVTGFQEPVSFFAGLKKTVPHLIILDLMLPGRDGFDICRALKQERATASVPVIMLTAKSAEVDRVLGLEMGAEDYMVKPFYPRELLARVKNLLKRADPAREKKELYNLAGVLKVDLQKHAVLVKEKEINLTATEFRLLTILLENRGWVLSRDQLLDKLWGDEKAVIDRTIDVHIRHLREKLGAAAKFIRNIRGVGYKFEE